MITIQRNSGITEYMSVEEFSRWMCLMEALHYIREKAKELNLDFDKMLKPLAIEDYVKDKYPSMLHDVQVEHSLGNL